MNCPLSLTHCSLRECRPTAARMRLSNSSSAANFKNACAAFAFASFRGYAAQNLSNSGDPSAEPPFRRDFLLDGGTFGNSGEAATLSRGCPEVVPRLSLLLPSPSANPARDPARRSVFSCRLIAVFEMNSSKLATVSPPSWTRSHPAAAIAAANPSHPTSKSSHAVDFLGMFPSESPSSWNLNQTVSSAPTTSFVVRPSDRAIAFT